LTYYRRGIDASSILANLGVAPKEFFLVSAHREENVDSDENFGDLIATLDTIHKRYDLPVIVSTHPRMRKRLLATGGSERPGVRFLPPLGFLDYVKLQMTARCVISDSGTITEESSILSFPAVTIRQAHERPEGMEEGTLIMCGLKPAHVMEAIDVVVAQQDAGIRMHVVHDYDVDNVSAKVLRIIVSYTEYVNRVVWFR